MSEITKRTEHLAELLSKCYSISNDSGSATVNDTEVYVKNLPKEVTLEAAMALQAYNSDFVAGAEMAQGKDSLKAFKANAKLLKTTAVIPMLGKDAIHISVGRSQDYSVPKRKGEEEGGEEKTVTKYCKITSRVENYSCSGSRGQLKLVRDMIEDLGFKELSGG